MSKAKAEQYWLPFFSNACWSPHEWYDSYFYKKKCNFHCSIAFDAAFLLIQTKATNNFPTFSHMGCDILSKSVLNFTQPASLFFSHIYKNDDPFTYDIYHYVLPIEAVKTRKSDLQPWDILKTTKSQAFWSIYPLNFSWRRFSHILCHI